MTIHLVTIVVLISLRHNLISWDDSDFLEKMRCVGLAIHPHSPPGLIQCIRNIYKSPGLVALGSIGFAFCTPALAIKFLVVSLYLIFTTFISRAAQLLMSRENPLKIMSLIAAIIVFIVPHSPTPFYSDWIFIGGLFWLFALIASQKTNVLHSLEISTVLLVLLSLKATGIPLFLVVATVYLIDFIRQRRAIDAYKLGILVVPNIILLITCYKFMPAIFDHALNYSFGSGAHFYSSHDGFLSEKNFLFLLTIGTLFATWKSYLFNFSTKATLIFSNLSISLPTFLTPNGDIRLQAPAYVANLISVFLVFPGKRLHELNERPTFNNSFSFRCAMAICSVVAVLVSTNTLVNEFITRTASAGALIQSVLASNSSSCIGLATDSEQFNFPTLLYSGWGISKNDPRNYMKNVADFQLLGESEKSARESLKSCGIAIFEKPIPRYPTFKNSYAPYLVQYCGTDYRCIFYSRSHKPRS